LCGDVSVRFFYTSERHPMFVTRLTRLSMTLASRVLTNTSKHKTTLLDRD
jgi:hypothetical protein